MSTALISAVDMWVKHTDNPDCSHTEGRTPTPRTHSAQSSLASIPTGTQSLLISGACCIVYIVTDTCYPTPSDFDQNKGSFRIDSVHSNKKTANARAKKVIYAGGQVNGGQFKVDVDKIIEEMRKGLFTGIGIGGNGDGIEGGCYARKCQVEGKMVDEESEDEGEGEEERGRENGEQEGRSDGNEDVEMG